MKHLFFLTVLLLSSAAVVTAQDAAVSSELKAYLITVDENGNENATEVTEVEPGQTIEYRLTYQNNLPEGISDLTPILPIPLEMIYQEGSADPEVSKVSLTQNEQDFQEIPITREVTLQNGEVEEQVVPASEYRRLQWVIPSLQSGESITLSARAKVIEN
ncbi:MAG: hypothetical protein FH748_06310 [Balneolaceae bacterium]|nr:hypothetical protein [Balneolaceae bacterium]